MICSKVTLALFALTGVVNGQCPGGKTGYSDATCAITQDAQLDAPMLDIVQAVSDFKAAIGSAGTADDPATADVDESTPATWDFAGAMRFYTANLQTAVAASGVAGLEEFIQAAGTGAGSFDGAEEELGRKEALVKSTQNNMLSALAIAKATQAGTEGDAAAAAQLWKEAKTLFFGNAALQSMSPSATSDKRCKNYDTCGGGDPSGDTGTASNTNIAIYDAFAAGEADPTTYADNAAIISAQNTIVYMQATLRYLNKMDKDNQAGAGASSKNQGEGWAFYKVIAPYLEGADADGANTINTAYDRDAVNTVNTNYCTGLPIVLKNLPSDTTLGDLGTLNEDYSGNGVDYTAGGCVGPSTAGLIQAAADMKAAIPSDCGDMTAAQAFYTTALTSPLYAIHSSLQSQVQALTGADAGLDALILDAFDGTGSFAAAAAAGADGCPARKEFIVKSIQNNLFSKMTMNLATAGAPDGMDLADDMTRGMCTGGVANCYNAGGSHQVQCGVPCTTDSVPWTQAEWVYFGYATPSLAPQATATKRASNYGTYGADGTTALANEAIVNAFAATSNDDMATGLDTIKAHVITTYMQATLRYLNKMDKDVAGGAATAGWKNQGEGWGFSLVIAEYLGTADAAVIDGMYNLATRNTASTNFCTGASVLLKKLPAGMGAIGTLNEDYTSSGVDYTCPGVDQVTLTEDAAKMKAAWDCADTSAAKSYYTTATSANIHTAMAGTSLQSQVQALTGADAGLDALIVAAFDGTGPFAAAAAAGADGCPARKEFVVKSISNNLFSKMTINYATSGVTSEGMELDTATANGYGACIGSDADSVHCYSMTTHVAACDTRCVSVNGDIARALWIFQGPTTPAISPFATGVKRAKNYGTCAPGTNVGYVPCVAMTNNAIIGALSAPDMDTVSAVSDQIITTYMSATLRYLNKMDKDVAGGAATAGWKNQGEGWGFSLVIAEYLGTADAAVIDGMYNLATRNTASTNFCTGASVLLKKLPAGMGAIGTLNEDYTSSGVDYTCPGVDTVGLIEDASAMKAAIGDCSDMLSAKAIYTTATSGGVHAATTAGMGSLQSQVQALTGTADADLDVLIVDAFDGTGAFAGAAAAGADGCPARKEFIVKSIQNNLFSKMTIGFAASNLVQAAWIFTGPTTPAIAPFATGVKRAKNYDQCAEGPGSQAPCTAATNTAVMAALAGTASAATATAVAAPIMATYIQATLRYVNKMDKDVAGGAATASWKNQGEGWGFSLVIADSLETTTATTIDGLYNLGTRNANLNNYCVAFDAITADALYIAADVGVLNEELASTTGGTADAPVCDPNAVAPGQCGSPFDFNEDGIVGVDDLLGLLASYGNTNTPCAAGR